MWIKELCVENFSGMNFHDTYEKNTVIISGRNGSGKSTRIKAFFWLMSGYTAANQPMNSNLYDNRVELSKDTPESRVWAKVVLDNGEEYMIERIARAKFQRRRGSEIYEKSSSDEYLYKIDNIAYQASDYREWISLNLVQEDMIRFCLDGSFFINLLYEDKRKARNLIERIVGTVERSEMKGDYADIDELLQKFSPEQIEEQSKNLSKSIDARLNEIPTVISQKEAEISEIKQTDFTVVQNEIDILESEQKFIEEKIFDYSARMKPLLEAKSKAESDKRMKQEVYDKAKKTYMQGFIDQDNNLCAEISRIEKENAEKKYLVENLKKTVEHNNEEIAEAERARIDLIVKVEQIKAEEYTSNNICPVCGQPIPEMMRVEAMCEFEKERKRRFDEAISYGKEISEKEEKLKGIVKSTENEIASIVFEDSEPLKQKLNALRTSDIAPFELTEQGKALQADIDAVVIPEVKMPEDGELKQQAADIKEKLKGLYMKKGLQSRLSSLETDIDELRSEQREKGAELAEFERRRQLVKDFKQEQMGILSLKVNEKLKFSRLDIWSTQKDGSIIPDVIIKNKEGVSFATANNASRLVTIIDIQRFFCECLGVNMPIFLDEASTIDEKNIPHYNNTQIFLLFRADTSLKIESK